MTSFDSSFIPLEFLRPLWLIVFFTIVLGAGIRFVLHKKFKPKLTKQSLIAAHLSAHIVSKPSIVKRLYFSRFYFLAAIISLALSGPSFHSIKIPLHEINKAQVLVMDLSYSMYATDLTPNRLSQARYKAIDFIKQSQEGETGLIAYAGDAFVIDPLTTDAMSILHQIPNLSPDIMPVTGSRADLALDKAIEILKNAGYKKGHIVFITDGITKKISEKMINTLDGKQWIVSVLAVGTDNGAPIRLANGSLLKDPTGNIIIPKLNTAPLYALSKAGHGLFLNATYTGNEVTRLANYYQANKLKNEQKNRKDKLSTQGFMKDDGYWIAFILLPLFLLLFRKGIFYMLVIGVTIPFFNPHADASIWKNEQQNAFQAYQGKNYKLASELYHAPLEKGCAYYKEKNYKSALVQFSRAEIEMPKNSAVMYNKGNALAQLKQLDKAIEAYKQAIAIRPNFKQAIENKKLLEALSKKQQQNKKQSDNHQKNKQQQNKKQSDKDQQNKQQQNKNQPNNNQQAKKQNKEQLNNKQQNHAPKSQVLTAQAKQATSTDEENTKQEKMPVWMKNMPDDPSFLLKREMQIEYQKRARAFGSHNNNGAIW